MKSLEKMRVLIVSQYYWPESFRINEIAESLHQKNCKVDVLTGQPNYPQGKIFDHYSALGLKSEMHNAVAIHRVPLFPRGSGAVRLMINYLTFILSASLFAPFKLRGKKFDVIFVYGVSPILAALPALLIGKIKSTPVVIWVQDLWPESLSATRYIKNKWILRCVETVVRFIYHRADLLLVQSEAFVDEVKPLSGGTPVVYYPNSVDESFAKNVISKDLPLPALKDKFIILFAGNIGTAQAVHVIVEAATILQEKPDIHFVILGDGRKREWMQDEINNRNLKNIVLPGKFPIETMPSFLQQASALLVTLTDEKIFSKTVPSKVQAYLASGRPIIAALNGEGARVIINAEAGLAVKAEDAEGLAQACLALYNANEKDRKEMGDKGHAYFKENYDHDQLVDELIDHFQTCINEKRLV